MDLMLILTMDQMEERGVMETTMAEKGAMIQTHQDLEVEREASLTLTPIHLEDLQAEREVSMTPKVTPLEEDQGKAANMRTQELEVEREVNTILNQEEKASMMLMMTTPELAAESQVNPMLMIITTERIQEEPGDSRMIWEDRNLESSLLFMRMLSP